MKTFLVVLTLALFSLTVASASPITCSANGSVTVGDPNSFSFTCGQLTFSNFEVVDPNGDAIGTVDINGGTYDSATGAVDLNLNPNLQASQDEGFLFEVTGGVTQLDLSVGGNDATVTERACSTPIPTSGPSAFLCPSCSARHRIGLQQRSKRTGVLAAVRHHKPHLYLQRYRDRSRHPSRFRTIERAGSKL